MKKMFFWAIAAAVAMASCSKNEEDVSLSKMSYTLYHSQNENIQGVNVSNLNWSSDNEFVAMISNGAIEGQFVGKTIVRESDHGLSFNVEVKPKYSLYEEPCLDFGVSMETIRSRYGTPYASESESLLYKNSNKNAPYYLYAFENGKLKYSYVVAIPLSAAYSLVDFLSERYLTADVDMNTYTAAYMHCYGKIADPKCDYFVGFTYNFSIDGFLVVYSNNASSNTRTCIDISKHIEDVLIKYNIKAE